MSVASSGKSAPGAGPDEGAGFAAYAVAAGAVAALLTAVMWPAAERVFGDSSVVHLVQAGVLVVVGHCAGAAAESILDRFKRP